MDKVLYKWNKFFRVIGTYYRRFPLIAVKNVDANLNIKISTQYTALLSNLVLRSTDNNADNLLIGFNTPEFASYSAGQSVEYGMFQLGTGTAYAFDEFKDFPPIIEKDNPIEFIVDNSNVTNNINYEIWIYAHIVAEIDITTAKQLLGLT